MALEEDGTQREAQIEQRTVTFHESGKQAVLLVSEFADAPEAPPATAMQGEEEEEASSNCAGGGGQQSAIR